MQNHGATTGERGAVSCADGSVLPLKLYVWVDVLTDYSSGMMVALADSVEEARALIRAADPNGGEYFPDGDLEKSPQVITRPAAFIVWGGA